MTAGALVAGNPVILKPAEQASVVAAKLAEILYTAGIPVHVLSYFSCEGSVVGEYFNEAS